MNRTLSPHHPISPIREEDLQTFKHLVPPTAAHLLALLGTHDALALFNAWPGVQIAIPKGPCNNAGGARRWVQIVAIVGESAALKLAEDMGGQIMEVPMFHSLRKARRNQAIRTAFDSMTGRPPAGGGMSKASAVHALGLMHSPITWRQIEVILDRAE